MSIKTKATPVADLEIGQIICVHGMHYYRVASLPTEDAEGTATLIKNTSSSMSNIFPLRIDGIYQVCEVENVNELRNRTASRPQITRGTVTTADRVATSERQAIAEAEMRAKLKAEMQAQQTGAGDPADPADPSIKTTDSDSNNPADPATGNEEVETGNAPVPNPIPEGGSAAQLDKLAALKAKHNK